MRCITGATSVASGASLGGTGTIGGDVTLADGATLTPGAGGAGTLTIGGDLSLAAGTTLAYEFGAANTIGGALNDLVNVGGDLVLDGTINVTVPAGGAFDVGVYRVFNYGGALTDNGLTLGVAARRQRRRRADLDRGPGQPGQQRRPHAQLLGRRGRPQEQRRDQWRQRHLAEQHRQRQLDRQPAAP